MDRDEELAMELSGIAAEDGTLGRDIPAGVLFVPPAPAIEGDELVWRAPESGHGDFGLARPDRRLLGEFIRLCEVPNRDIAAFAATWGMLQVSETEDMLPSDWVLTPNFPPTAGVGFTVTSGWPEEGLRESLTTWREHSALARAILNVAAALHAEEFGRLQDWRTLYPRVPEDRSHWTHVFGFPNPQEALSLGWTRLRIRLSDWLRTADVRPDLSIMTAKRPEFVLSGRGLYGAVGIQLLFAVCAAHGLAVCTYCGAPYARPRRAARTRRNYCKPCSDSGASLRDAKRDSDQRKREAVRLASEGLSPQQVAAKLGRPEKTIRGWINKDASRGKAPRQVRKEAGRAKKRHKGG